MFAFEDFLGLAAKMEAYGFRLHRLKLSRCETECPLFLKGHLEKLTPRRGGAAKAERRDTQEQRVFLRVTDQAEAVPIYSQADDRNFTPAETAAGTAPPAPADSPHEADVLRTFSCVDEYILPGNLAPQAHL